VLKGCIKNREMQTSRKKQLLIVGGILLGIITVLVVIFFPRLQQRWTEPLGPSLGLPTRTPTSVAVAQIESTSTPAGLDNQSEQQESPRETTAAAEVTHTAAPIPTKAPLCGGPPVMNVLALGIDGAENYLYGLSDVIRVVRVDFVTPKVTVLDIPRDLWVEIPDIAEKHGIFLWHSGDGLL
jgi:hypothetical protein